MGVLQSLKDYILRKKEEREFKKFQQNFITNKYLSITGRHKGQYIQSHGKTLPNGDLETVVYSELGPIRETLVSPKNSHKAFSVQYDGFFNETNKQGEEEKKYGFIECSISANDEKETTISLLGAILDNSQFRIYTEEFVSPRLKGHSKYINISPEALREYINTRDLTSPDEENPSFDKIGTERLINAYSSLKNDFETSLNNEKMLPKQLYSIKNPSQN